MRPYSLSGTRPACTSRSVPRLMAPNSARTCTSPALGAPTASSCNSARPGPTYQRALPCILAIILGCHFPQDDAPGSRHRVEIKGNTRNAFRPHWTWMHTAISSNARKDTQSPFMLERSACDEVVVAAPAPLFAWRPTLVFLSVGLTMAGLIWLAVIALSPGGFGAVDLVLVALFAVTLPWYVIGFWNATIGLLIMRFARDPVAAVMPVAGRVRGDEPITASTALLLCIRNEPPERVVRMLEPMMEGLAARGVGERFHVYVLSDTSEADMAAAEDARFAALAAAWRGQIALTYRRRA